MPFEDDTAWLDTQIAAVEAQILAYNAAITALAAGAQHYTLDTGQSRQSVSKAELSSLRITLEALENRRSELRARRYGTGFNIRPGW